MLNNFTMNLDFSRTRHVATLTLLLEFLNFYVDTFENIIQKGFKTWSKMALKLWLGYSQAALKIFANQ